VRVSGAEEETRGDPREVALENARRKARAVHAPGELILGADTDVALDGDILGKPADAEQAARFLERLSGRTHEVVGGVVLTGVGEFVEVTEVDFAPLDRSTVDWYVRSREW
jgi:septum formation protein